MRRFKVWLREPAGEWNGIAPDATHLEQLIMYPILAVLVVGLVVMFVVTT